jgi:hypothetical protein
VAVALAETLIVLACADGRLDLVSNRSEAAATAVAGAADDDDDDLLLLQPQIAQSDSPSQPDSSSDSSSDSDGGDDVAAAAVMGPLHPSSVPLTGTQLDELVNVLVSLTRAVTGAAIRLVAVGGGVSCSRLLVGERLGWAVGLCLRMPRRDLSGEMPQAGDAQAMTDGMAPAPVLNEAASASLQLQADLGGIQHGDSDSGSSFAFADSDDEDEEAVSTV